MAKDPKKSIEEVNKELGYLEDKLLTIADSLSNSIRVAMEDIRDEALGVSEIFGKNLNKSIKDIARESDRILSNTLRLSQGSAKLADIKRSEFNLDLKKLSIQRNLDALLANGVDLGKERKQYEDEIEEALDDQRKILEDQVSYAKQIQKNMGITGNLIKGMSKIPLFSDLLDTETVLARIQVAAADKEGSRLKVLGAALKQIGSNIKANLSDPIVLLAIYKKLYDIGAQFSQQTADMARNMGINTDQAHQFNKAILEASQNSNTQAASQKNFLEANNNINNALGTSVVYSKKMLEDQTALVKQAGLTNEEAAQLARFSILTGKTQENIYDSIGKQTKGVLSNKKVLIEVLKTSGQLSAQYKNNPELIAKAVIQAQKLGLTLEQAQKASRGLLDFESSITAELEAELLTGRDLNLEKARYLALQGKSAEAAEEIARQVGSSAQFSRMNVIQQEALAKATNMTVDELADSLRKREEIAKIQRNELGENGKRLSYEEAATKLKEQQMSASEKMAASVDKMKESFASIIAGPLGTIVDFISGVFNKIAQSKFLSGVLGFVGAAAALAALGAGILSVGRGIKDTFLGKKNKSLTKKDIKEGMDESLNRFENPGTLKVTLYGIKGQAAQFLKQNSGQGGSGAILGGKKGRRGRRGKTNLLGSALDLESMIEDEEEFDLESSTETTTKPKKGFGRIKNAFKKGGPKGGFKSIGRMLKGAAKGIGKGISKGAGIFGTLASLGIDIAEGGLNWESLSRAGISGLGSLLGGAAGSFLAPGAGTIGGGIAGGMAGDWLANQIFGEKPEGLATGGLVTSTGLAKVDKGEVYLGGNSLGVLKNMLDALQEQNNSLKALLNKNQDIYLDSTKVGNAFSLNT
jgi:hypothetical protein